MVATAGLFAPTIRHHKGIFYIICTNCTSDGTDFKTANFYITTDDLWSNQWSDPIFIDFNGIDPSIFWDDDDRAYIQGSFRLDRLKQPSCTIKQFQIDLETGKAISEQKEIWPGYAKIDSEGPHIYKKDGWYYLLIAEGGTFEYHMLSIARAKSVWGPYESYEKNPLMTSDGKPDEYIQNIGHGELFQDLDGKWWAAVLGVRDCAGRSPMGRETFLTAVDWPEGGWPRISQPKMSFEREHSSNDNSSLGKQDEKVEHCYIRTPVLQDYEFTSDQRIFLRSSESDLSIQVGTTTFLGQRQRSLSCFSSVSLDLDNTRQGQDLNVGLALYKDAFRHAEVFYDYSTSKVCFSITNKSKDPPTKIAVSTLPTGKLSFRIQADERNYTFSYQDESSKEWIRVGVLDALEMTARDFTGTMFGLFANGKGQGQGILVPFVDFKVSS